MSPACQQEVQKMPEAQVQSDDLQFVKKMEKISRNKIPDKVTRSCIPFKQECPLNDAKFSFEVGGWGELDFN